MRLLQGIVIVGGTVGTPPAGAVARQCGQKRHSNVLSISGLHMCSCMTSEVGMDVGSGDGVGR
jgi:hypothetical protein